MPQTHINGSNLRWKLNGTGILAATSGSIEISQDLKTTSIEHKDDSVDGAGWSTSKPGSKSFSGSCEAFLLVEGDLHTVFDALDGGTELDFQFSTDVEGNVGFSGKVLVANISVTAQDKEEATYSISFTGTGALSKVTV